MEEKPAQPPAKISKSEEEQEKIIKLLEERLEEHGNNKDAVQCKLTEIMNKLREQIDELEDRIAKELEEKFTFEDDKLQRALNELCENSTIDALQKAKAELLVEQSYDIVENNFESKHDLTTLYKLKTKRCIVPRLVEVRKPTNVRVAGVKRGVVYVQFTFLNPDEERVLSGKDIANLTRFKCMIFKKGNEQESKEYSFDENEGNDFFRFTPDILEPETTYGIRVKMVVGDRESEWSDEIAEFTPGFKECYVWKKCPDDVHDSRKYRVDGKNPSVATNVSSGDGYCTIIGSTYIPLNKVTQWSIKVLKLRSNNGDSIFIGVAPNDIDQNVNYNCNKCGWYFNCYSSELCSGPPHNYWDKEHGPRKGTGQYVRTRDSVGVVMDTTKGELSFVLNEENLGVAYEGIPLDKPLVPCVILGWQGDSVELII